MSIADEVLLVLMPGSGDSVQALKAGIMEIPDVIAVNKMDQPGAKAMLNDIRGVIALDPEARLAARRSSSPRRFVARESTGSGARSSSGAMRSPPTGSSRRAGAATSPARWWQPRPRVPAASIEARDRARTRRSRSSSRRCSGARSIR